MKNNRRIIKIIKVVGMTFFILVCSLGFSVPNGNQQSGKNFSNIYLYDTLLLISDSYTGIKIYSVASPTSPQYKNTISLKGNSGMAMKGNMVYANAYGGILGLRLKADFTCDTVVKIKEDLMIDPMPIDYYRPGLFSCYPVIGCTSEDMGSNGTGVGGSYAIFAVIDTFLYYLDGNNLITFDIANPDTAKELSRTYIDWTVETLFPTEKYLFIGGRGGMYVLDRKDPAFPKKICTLQHFQAYDPVVVRDTVAYVTLRAGNWGGNAKDVLLVVSVANPQNAYVLNEVSTFTPYGLAVLDTLVYVSNGHNGFTLFSVADPSRVSQIKYWNTPETKDFIWYGNRLYIMGFSNVMIYNVDDPCSPMLLAKIE